MSTLRIHHDEHTPVYPHVEPKPDGSDVPTDEQVNMQQTVPQHVDDHFSKVQDQAGTGEPDALGG
jgi:hypothetical protein